MLGNQSIEDVLAVEIKKDIAERYFSFRKLIEEDKMDLVEKVRQYSFILEKRLSFDLIRIYVLLKDEELIQSFMELANLDQRLFFDPCITSSPAIARRVLECQRFPGFTRAGRFKKYLLCCYDNLFFHAQIYQRGIAELQKAQGIIVEEIRQFYANNDLSAIMSFLHHLGNVETCGCMQGGMETGLVEGLDRKLAIGAPPAIEQMMTVLPPLNPPDQVEGRLKKLAQLAYKRQDPQFLKLFDRGEAPCDRRE